MDRYFYSVETDGYGNKDVHMLGNVYRNDTDTTETDYRFAEWKFLYLTFKELKKAIDGRWLFGHLCNNVKYLDDITEDEALDICGGYFCGESGNHLPVSCVSEETPSGNYWFDREEMYL